jgi:hypothetical protein
MLSSILLVACKAEQSLTDKPLTPTLVDHQDVALLENNDLHCPHPQIPDYVELNTIQATLPDPFLSKDGSRITHIEQWPCRRAEISQQVQAYMLGVKPLDKVVVTGNYEQEQIQVTVKQNDKTLSFAAQITLPTSGKAPYPAMIGIGRVSLDNEALLKQGVAIINFPNNELAEQQNGGSRGKGKFYEFYGQEHSAGALMAWSWGVSRLIDALELTQNSPINVNKLAITGCSRNGKGALVAGAFDQRIVLTIPQESGAGGSANWRISDVQLAAGTNVQTLRQIVTENVWFTANFADFSESVTLLPFDQHQVLSLVAPRGLLIIDNAIDWLGIESSYLNALAAKTVWQALGQADFMGVSQTQEHQHCQQPESQQVEINAFVQQFLFDSHSADTHVQRNENALNEDLNQWIKWSTPVLK